MDPKNYRAMMFGMLVTAMERDKRAHRTSIDELARLCPKGKRRLDVLHKEYCQGLDRVLAKARRLLDSPFVDDEGGVDDPGLSLLAYLSRDEPSWHQGLDPDLHDIIRMTFGQPVPIDKKD